MRRPLTRGEIGAGIRRTLGRRAAATYAASTRLKADPWTYAGRRTKTSEQIENMRMLAAYQAEFTSGRRIETAEIVGGVL